MKLATRSVSAVVATVATAGASTLLFGVAPASAAPSEACGTVGDLVAPGVCEVTFTSGTSIFTPTSEMTQLEVLLVGAGGHGATGETVSSKGYAAGGGGEVKIVDFSGATSALNVTVPESGTPGSVTDGVTNATVNNGEDGSVDSTTAIPTGGASGSGHAGAVGPAGATSGAGGGGAAGDASGLDGGEGVVVSAIAPGGSLFAGDTRCFGGGGAVDSDALKGIPGCGGGGTDSDGNSVDPVVNSGGGGTTGTFSLTAGASGFVAIRWNAANVTLSFDANGHGVAPADQSVPAGTAPTDPGGPTAAGYQFDGWYTDASLATPVDFSTPLVESTTVYAKWSAVLAATGATVDAAQLWLGFGVLFAGAGMVTVAYRRKRRLN